MLKTVHVAKTGAPMVINTDHIVYIETATDGCLIVMANGHSVKVAESLEEVTDSATEQTPPAAKRETKSSGSKSSSSKSGGAK